MVNALPFCQVYKEDEEVIGEFQDMRIPIHEHEIRKTSTVIPNENVRLSYGPDLFGMGHRFKSNYFNGCRIRIRPQPILEVFKIHLALKSIWIAPRM